jgi:hypothetical protein
MMGRLNSPSLNRDRHLLLMSQVLPTHLILVLLRDRQILRVSGDGFME